MAPHGRFQAAAATVVLLLAVRLGSGCGGHLAASDGGDGAPVDTRPVDLSLPPDAPSGGYALSFDGINDYATAGNAGFPAVGSEQTESLWVNYASLAGTQDFLVMRTDFSSGLQLGIRDGTVTVWRTSSGRTLVAAPTPPAAGKWHHVTYTFDRTTHTLYVNGAVVATSTAANDSRTPTQAWFGTVDGSAELFKGSIDEVRVWSVVRTTAEIQKDMLHRPPTGEAGLVTYWTFDDAQSGGRSADTTGSTNAVTLGDGIPDRMPTRVLSDAPVGP